MAEFVKVAQASEVPEGKIKKAVVKGQEIALYNVEGKLYATTNICPHQGGPLDEGELDGDTIVCPWHGWMFKVPDGCLVMNPRITLRTYELKVDNDTIYINL